MVKYCIFLLTCLSCFSQEKIESTTFFRPEFLVGRHIPSYDLQTGLNPKLALGLSYAKKHKLAQYAWQKYLHNPTTGVSLYFTNYGSKELGNSIAVIPFIEFPINKKQNLHTKFGIGASYFDTKYHRIDNPTNTEISTDFTWAIQGVLYYDLPFKKWQKWRLGLGYFHYSNGHYNLPNKGSNTALLSVSTFFGEKNNILIGKKTAKQTDYKTFGDYFYAIKYGQGFQAFVTEDSKVKVVNSVAITGGIIYKEFIKLKLGLNYRFYQHYYDYIIENNTTPYIDNATKNASNINVNFGAEAMLGRFGVDLEFGVNLYKPFYKKHYDLQIAESNSGYKIKSLFLGRLGLKMYAINNNKNPKNNFYLAGHINSNFGQADFNEISVGFVHRILSN